MSFRAVDERIEQHCSVQNKRAGHRARALPLRQLTGSEAHADAREPNPDALVGLADARELGDFLVSVRTVLESSESVVISRVVALIRGGTDVDEQELRAL